MAAACLMHVSLGSAQALPPSAGAVEPPELLSPGTTIALADVHDVILHALVDAAAPRWLRLQARSGHERRVSAQLP